LTVPTIIGVRKGERNSKQPIVVNVTLFVDTRKCGRTDNIEDTTDYSAGSKALVHYLENSKHFTLEAMCTALARICCIDFGVQEVIIKADKPSAIPLARSPSVEIRRTREFFVK
jgi:FolB domain-containing protein